jgi:hypothetical protein
MLIDLSIDVEKLNVRPVLNTVAVDSVKINSKFLSPQLDLEESKKFFNQAFTAAIPIFNVLYSEFNYEVPQNIWTTFKLTDLTITYYDQYL